MAEGDGFNFKHLRRDLSKDITSFEGERSVGDIPLLHDQWCCVAFSGSSSTSDTGALDFGGRSYDRICEGDDEIVTLPSASKSFSLDSAGILWSHSLETVEYDACDVERLSRNDAHLCVERTRARLVSFSDPLVTSVKSRPRTEGRELKNLFYDEYDIRRFQHEYFLHQNCEENNIAEISK
eukprot:59511_1